MTSSVDRPSCHYPMTVHSSSKAGSAVGCFEKLPHAELGSKPAAARAHPVSRVPNSSWSTVELVTRTGSPLCRRPPSPHPRRPASPRSRDTTCSRGPSSSPPRAASASTRRQYRAIFHAFGDWPAGELGPPPSSQIWTPVSLPPMADASRRAMCEAGGRRRRRRRRCGCICRYRLRAGLGPRIGRRGRGRAVVEARAGAAGDAHRHRLRQSPRWRWSA